MAGPDPQPVAKPTTDTAKKPSTSLGGGAGPSSWREGVTERGRGLGYDAQVAQTAVGGPEDLALRLDRAVVPPKSDLTSCDAEIGKLRKEASLALEVMTSGTFDLLAVYAAQQTKAVQALIKETGGSPFVGLTHSDWAAYFPNEFGSSPAGLPEPGSGPSQKDAGGNVGSALLNAGGNTLLDKAVTGVLPKVAPKLAARSLGVLSGLVAGLGAGGPVGFAVGILVNLAWDAISSILSDGYDESDTRSSDAGKATVTAHIAAEARFQGAHLAAIGQLGPRIQPLHQAAHGSLDPSELRGLATWAKTMHTNAIEATSSVQSGESVGLKLISRWCAQRTADGVTANRQTEPGSLRRAREHLLAKDDPGLVSRLGTFERPDLFLEQLRFMWGRFGVDLDVPIALLEDRYKANKDLPLAQIAGRLSPITVNLSRIASPRMFAEALDGKYIATRVGPARPEALELVASMRVFEFTCEVSLTTVGPSIIVDDLEFLLKPDAGHDAFADYDAKSYDAQQGDELVPGRVFGPFVRLREWNDTPQR